MRFAVAAAAPMLIAATVDSDMSASKVVLILAGVAILVFIRGVMLRDRVDRRRRQRGDDGDCGGDDGWFGDGDGDGGGGDGGGGD